MTELEHIPEDEAGNIAKIATLTVQQLDQRYPAPQPILRGVHAKDHGCVAASFKINANLPDELRVGAFACAGHEYDALIRFSNASVSLDPDSAAGPAGLPMHGSRGMAVKVLGVTGTALLPGAEPLAQDFVMINQPVFAFANVEDYLALSEILVRDKDNPTAFFARAKLTDADGHPTPAAQRTLRTLGIVSRIRSSALTATPAAYQSPPPSPLDNQYFSAAPFLFGPDRALKFSVKPLAPVTAETLNVSDPRYLRTALHQRLTAPGARPVVFTFQMQVRTADDLAPSIDADIEDATVEWDAARHPFIDAGTITIQPQDFETEERRALCESLTFSPWHGLAEHRPLGGINRLRCPVYEASGRHRLGAKWTGGCPVSGIS